MRDATHVKCDGVRTQYTSDASGTSAREKNLRPVSLPFMY